MTRHYHLTDTALGDLEVIWLYIAGDSQAHADRFIGNVEQILQMLADYPLIGRERSEFGTSLRSYPVGDYLVFYKPVPDGVEVRTVLHGSQDLRRFIGKR